MCGIVGYVGGKQASHILLDGLSKLEYRGYDSAGMAVKNDAGEIICVKAKGKLQSLYDKTDNGDTLKGNIGIGHTRWATHGEPSELNAHPHFSMNKEVYGVHNGIIENFQDVKSKLLRHDYKFYSDTDTEILINLIEFYLHKYGIGPIDAINRTMVRVRGSYALAIMFKDYPNCIFVARKDSPIIVGVNEDESYIASDIPAILKYTRNVYYIGDMECACIEAGKATFYNLDGEQIVKESTTITIDEKSAEKDGYPHFMLKEIYEQPKATRETISSLIVDGKINLMGNVFESQEEINSISNVIIVACGSAYHVGVSAQYIFEDLVRIPTRVELASEFRYRNPILNKNDLVIIISQSGETADSIAALREAKEQGVKTLAVVNVVGSTISHEADRVIYTHAGPEIAVATTKAYSCQLIAMYAIAVEFAYVRGKIDEEEYDRFVKDILNLPDKIAKMLEDKERIQWFASKFANAKDMFFIGRGLDYAISLEGSLKMKEISYIHSESYAAGELKHGTISLVEDNILVIGVLTQSKLFEKMISNLVEVKSRGAFLMGITTVGHYSIEDTVNFAIYLPKTDEHFTTSLAIIPLQLLAYYVSVAKGLDVDKPRNLAKSVTVE